MCPPTVPTQDGWLHKTIIKISNISILRNTSLKCLTSLVVQRLAEQGHSLCLWWSLMNFSTLNLSNCFLTSCKLINWQHPVVRFRGYISNVWRTVFSYLFHYLPVGSFTEIIVKMHFQLMFRSLDILSVSDLPQFSLFPSSESLVSSKSHLEPLPSYGHSCCRH